MTAARLAKKLGVSATMLSHWKMCKHLPGVVDFIRILDVLGVSQKEILGILCLDEDSVRSEMDRETIRIKRAHPRPQRQGRRNGA